MSREKKILGIRGELIAAGFLKQKGYKILETNVRTPFGELDIVARKKNLLIFVEVKTRISPSLGPPSCAVTRAKRIHIIKNALYYIDRHNSDGTSWRIDVVSIKLSNDQTVESVEIIENAVTVDSYDYRGG